MTDASQMHKQ